MSRMLQLETSVRPAGLGSSVLDRLRGLMRSGTWRVRALLLALLCQIACASAADTISLEVGGQTLRVELALSAFAQARGLMYRKSMAQNHGMLFVYDSPQQVSYWMKNTFIPLSIAFIDGNKRIVNMADMAPNNSSRSYPSRGPVKYVLEVNQGWFAQHGVKEGDVVKFELPGKQP